MDISYIAGLIDGDGTITLIVRRDHTCAFGYYFIPKIGVAQQEREVLDAIKECLGMGQIIYIGKGSYEWVVYNWDECRKIVSLLEGKLVVKARQLELLKEFLFLKEPYQAWTKEKFIRALEIAEELARLKKKGNVRKTIERIRAIRRFVESINYTPEIRGKKISERLKGRKFSEEARRKMSEAAKRRMKFVIRDEGGKMIGYSKELYKVLGVRLGPDGRVTCPKCGYTWRYRGRRKTATCPKCSKKILLFRPEL